MDGMEFRHPLETLAPNNTVTHRIVGQIVATNVKKRLKSIYGRRGSFTAAEIFGLGVTTCEPLLDRS